MFELLVIVVVSNLAAHMVASGLAGSLQSQRVGAPRWQGLLLGGLVPWIGLVILAAHYARRPRHWVLRPARSGFGLVGVLLLLLGGLGVAASMFLDWGSLRGSALQFTTGVKADVGSNASVTTFAFVTAAILVGLGLGAWWHGGLRFAMLAAFLTTVIGTTFADVAVVADLVSRLATQADDLSGGAVSVRLLIGEGAAVALVGCVAAFLGSLALLLHRPMTVADARELGREPKNAAVAASAPVGAPLVAAAEKDPWNDPMPGTAAWGQQQYGAGPASGWGNGTQAANDEW